jgi:UDP-glucose:O-linked fucose beta-1,3-glucosyltransferase
MLGQMKYGSLSYKPTPTMCFNIHLVQVFSLENRQIQLQLALEERTKEISIHKDMLRVQIKNAEEERYSANSEFRGRVSRVEKLKKRYEILMTQFSPEDGEEEHSQAYYVIKSAQVHETVQKIGPTQHVHRKKKSFNAKETTWTTKSERPRKKSKLCKTP